VQEIAAVMRKLKRGGKEGGANAKAKELELN